MLWTRSLRSPSPCVSPRRVAPPLSPRSLSDDDDDPSHNDLWGTSNAPIDIGSVEEPEIDFIETPFTIARRNGSNGHRARVTVGRTKVRSPGLPQLEERVRKADRVYATPIKKRSEVLAQRRRDAPPKPAPLARSSERSFDKVTMTESTGRNTTRTSGDDEANEPLTTPRSVDAASRLIERSTGSALSHEEPLVSSSRPRSSLSVSWPASGPSSSRSFSTWSSSVPSSELTAPTSDLVLGEEQESSDEPRRRAGGSDTTRGHSTSTTKGSTREAARNAPSSSLSLCSDRLAPPPRKRLSAGVDGYSQGGDRETRDERGSRGLEKPFKKPRLAAHGGPLTSSELGSPTLSSTSVGGLSSDTRRKLDRFRHVPGHVEALLLSSSSSSSSSLSSTSSASTAARAHVASSATEGGRAGVGGLAHGEARTDSVGRSLTSEANELVDPEGRHTVDQTSWSSTPRSSSPSRLGLARVPIFAIKEPVTTDSRRRFPPPCSDSSTSRPSSRSSSKTRPSWPSSFSPLRPTRPRSRSAVSTPSSTSDRVDPSAPFSFSGRPVRSSPLPPPSTPRSSISTSFRLPPFSKIDRVGSKGTQRTADPRVEVSRRRPQIERLTFTPIERLADFQTRKGLSGSTLLGRGVRRIGSSSNVSTWSGSRGTTSAGSKSSTTLASRWRDEGSFQERQEPVSGETDLVGVVDRGSERRDHDQGASSSVLGGRGRDGTREEIEDDEDLEPSTRADVGMERRCRVEREGQPGERRGEMGSASRTTTRTRKINSKQWTDDRPDRKSGTMPDQPFETRWAIYTDDGDEDVDEDDPDARDPARAEYDRTGPNSTATTTLPMRETIRLGASSRSFRS